GKVSVEEIEQVKGFGKKTAQLIWEYVKGK
ncbi:unnamed protein product, partial [marine sediment metagenome]